MKTIHLNKTGVKILCVLTAVSLSSGAVSAAAVPTVSTSSSAGMRSSGGKSNTDSAQTEASDPRSSATITIGESYKKDETVYVNLDPQGNAYDQTVVNWLHSDEAGVTIRDRTTLKSIENVKGDEEPQRSGNNLTWTMQGNDLYYRGKTDGKLPVDLTITYRLDGREMKPEEIAGKSGRLEMNLKFTNNLKRSVIIGGKKTDLYIPVMAAVAFSLPDDTFSNVTVSDGTVQTDGSKKAVALMSMPGLEASLNLKEYDLPGFEEMDFPEEFTVTANVQDFEMGPIAVVLTTKIPELEKLDMAEDLDDMRLDLEDLRGAQNDLTAWDPSYRTRSLFTDPIHTAGARVLVDDIFRFYDQDVAILDLLPKYITEDHIQLYDRIQNDFDEVDIDELLESDSIDALVDRLTRKNIDKIRILLDDYDTIKKMDTDDLNVLLDETADLLEKARRSGDVIDTCKVMMKYADDMMSMMKALEGSALEKMLDQDERTLESALSSATLAMGRQQAARQNGFRSLDDLDSAISRLKSSSPLSKTEEDALRQAILVALKAGKIGQNQYNGLSDLIDYYLATVQGTAPTIGMSSDMLASQSDVVAADETEADEQEAAQIRPNQAEDQTDENQDRQGGTDKDEEDEFWPEDLMEKDKVSGGDRDEEEKDSSADNGPDGPDGEERAREPEEPENLNDQDGPGEGEEDRSGADLNTDSIVEQTPVQSENTQSAELAQFAHKEAPENQLHREAAFIVQSVESNAGYSTASAFDPLIETASGVQQIINAEIQKSVGPLNQELAQMLVGVKKLKGGIEDDLGGRDIARQRIDAALEFTDTMIPQLKKIVDKADKLADRVDRHDDGAQGLADEMKNMIRDLEDNESNIQALRRVLDDHDAGKFESIRTHWPRLKQDMRDVRPILDELRDDLKDPVLDRSLHASPETTDVLLQMKEDLFEQRNISEILRDSLADDKVQVAARMFGTFDRLQEKGSVDKYVGQVDDADLLLERKDAITGLSKQYRVYTDATQEADTSLKFIMKTDEIEKPKEPQAPEIQETEKQGFLDWARGVIGKLTGKK